MSHKDHKKCWNKTKNIFADCDYEISNFVRAERYGRDRLELRFCCFSSIWKLTNIFIRHLCIIVGPVHVDLLNNIFDAFYLPFLTSLGHIANSIWWNGKVTRVLYEQWTHVIHRKKLWQEAIFHLYVFRLLFPFTLPTPSLLRSPSHSILFHARCALYVFRMRCEASCTKQENFYVLWPLKFENKKKIAEPNEMERASVWEHTVFFFAHAPAQWFWPSFLSDSGKMAKSAVLGDVWAHNHHTSGNNN